MSIFLLSFFYSILFPTKNFDLIKPITSFTQDSQALTTLRGDQKTKIQHVEKINQDITNPKFYENLPVGSVHVSSTPDAWGTVILLPQYHKIPGSNDLDPKNDTAVQTQKELTQILQAIAHNSDGTYTFIEGELVGPINEAKRSNYSTFEKHLESFKTDASKLDTLLQDHQFPKQVQTNVHTVLEDKIEHAQRTLYLAGAPYALEPQEQAKLTLLGTENKETQEKSAHIVRNYIYANDRLSQLTNSTRAKTLPSANSTLTLNDELLRTLLKSGQPVKTLDTSLDMASSIADSRSLSDVQTVVHQVEQSYGKLNSLYQDITHPNNTNTSSTPPSRSQNPYQNVTNPEQIKKIIRKHEKDINDLILNQRNKETAQVVGDTLRQKNKDIAIVQFGHAHTPGIAEQLIADGLNVITVQTLSVEDNSQTKK